MADKFVLGFNLHVFSKTFLPEPVDDLAEKFYVLQFISAHDLANLGIVVTFISADVVAPAR